MKMIELKSIQVVNGSRRNPNDGPVLVDQAEYDRLVKVEKTANCVTKNYSSEHLANMAPPIAEQ